MVVVLHHLESVVECHHVTLFHIHRFQLAMESLPAGVTIRPELAVFGGKVSEPQALTARGVNSAHKLVDIDKRGGAILSKVRQLLVLIEFAHSIS